MNVELLSMEPLVVRVAEAARMLSISRSKAYELIQKGEIPHVRLGHTSIRVPMEGLKALVKTGAPRGK